MTSNLLLITSQLPRLATDLTNHECSLSSTTFSRLMVLLGSHCPATSRASHARATSMQPAARRPQSQPQDPQPRVGFLSSIPVSSVRVFIHHPPQTKLLIEVDAEIQINYIWPCVVAVPGALFSPS
ncbi:hypothetical protein VTJ04DRAFT_2599 [Mycothermus thermophilus]|uniref:uncharacterized protein n=1 Tax=Humicola insolens TaxID=85995 RepID=UPI0037420342